MGWELTKVKVDETGGIASSFHFEIVFTGDRNQAECLLRGDGIVLGNGRVRFNRSNELATTFQDLGLKPEELIRQLERRVLAKVKRPFLPVA